MLKRILAAGAVMLAVSAFARDYYVAPDGSGDAFTTNAPGALVATERLKFEKGDSIVLADGLYRFAPGDYHIFGENTRWPSGPTALGYDAVITFRSASGNPKRCVLDGGREWRGRALTSFGKIVISGIGFRYFGGVDIGGAVASANGMVTNCIFVGNEAMNEGGALYGTWEVADSYFADNLTLAGDGGAAAGNQCHAEPYCRRSVFVRNGSGGERRFATFARFAHCAEGCEVTEREGGVYGRRDGKRGVDSITVRPGDDLLAVRDRLRKERTAGGRAEIVFADGVYHFTSNAVLDLNRRDDGLTLRAQHPGKVEFSGAVEFLGAEFKPIADPALKARFAPEVAGRILARPLSDAELAWFGPQRKAFLSGTPGDGSCYRVSPPYSLCNYRVDSEATHLELDVRPYFIVNDCPQTPARWPNLSEVRLEKGEIEAAGGDKETGFLAKVRENRPARWRFEGQHILAVVKPQAWTVATEVVAGWDKEKEALVMAPGVGIPYWGYFEDVLEEIDEPGEWCVDHASRQLCYLPAEGFGPTTPCRIAHLQTTMVRIHEASDITIEGIKFVGKIAQCAIIASDCERTRIRGCEFTALGSFAISMSGWTNEVRSCDFKNLYLGAVDLRGGDARTLTHGNNLIDNCRFLNCGVLRTSGELIRLRGCGNTFRHSEVRHTPHAAINFGGPDMLIEYNRIVDTCSRNGDCGSVYGWGGFLSYGTVIRHNDIGASGKSGHGVYLDDRTSGVSVYGNVIRDYNGGGVFIGGGRDLCVSNNVILYGSGAIQLDNRGLWWPSCIGDWREGHKALVKVYDYTNRIWAARYPNVLRWAEDGTNFNAHTDNHFDCNLALNTFYYGYRLAEFKGLWGPEGRLTSSDNVYVRTERARNPMEVWRIGGVKAFEGDASVPADLGFVKLPACAKFWAGDPYRWELGDMNLKSDAWIKRVIPRFQPLEWDKIGPYRDEWRREVTPIETETETMAVWKVQK